MSKLTKADAERKVRAFWKKQATPRDVARQLPAALAAEKYATTWLRSAGFDFKQAAKLQAQKHAEWDRNVPRAAKAAALRWAGHIKRAQASAAAWADGMMTTAFGSPPTQSSFIDQPISILASNPAILKASQIAPGNSFAKILVDRKSNGTDTVTFAFPFRNGAPTPFLFDFDTLINASGHLSVRAGAGFVNFAELIVDAKLDVLTTTPVSDVRFVAAVGVLSGAPPFFRAESRSRTLAQTRFLTAPGIVLQSNQSIVLQVSLVLSSDLDDGRAVGDFNTGGFRVLCPVVLIARRAVP